MKNSDVSYRFLETIDVMGIRDAAVCERTNYEITAYTMAKIRNGKQGVSMSSLCSYLRHFPTVNANYIFTGKGNMFNNSDTDDARLAAEMMVTPSKSRVSLELVKSQLLDMIARKDSYIEALTDRILGL